MAFLHWAATPQLMAFLNWTETLASLACLCADATLAGPTFLSWAETPRVVVLLKGLDREILPCRVQFATKIAEKVKTVISTPYSLSHCPPLSGVGYR